MAVAWIGNRETLLERAVGHAAALLHSSRCPVFSFDTDIHGTRAAIALAERVGASYDHTDGVGLARETALFTDRGGMFVAPGEVRRRADLVAIVGELPAIHHGFVAELAETVPDLTASNAREFFLIGHGKAPLPLNGGRKLTRLSCGKAADLGGALAALRAQCAGRQVSAPVSNFARFQSALASAKFPVFLFSGHSADALALEMLQGLLADLNWKSRASALHLPSSESGWGSTLASTWMTGFPVRTSFSRGFPEYDPWRFDAARQLEAGEADFHLWISADAKKPPAGNGTKLVAMTKTPRPVTGAEVTFAIGKAGVDHDAVSYSARTGSLTFVSAEEASRLPSAATILRSIAEHIPAGAALPC